MHFTFLNPQTNFLLFVHIYWLYWVCIYSSGANIKKCVCSADKQTKLLGTSTRCTSMLSSSEVLYVMRFVSAFYLTILQFPHKYSYPNILLKADVLPWSLYNIRSIINVKMVCKHCSYQGNTNVNNVMHNKHTQNSIFKCYFFYFAEINLR